MTEKKQIDLFGAPVARPKEVEVIKPAVPAASAVPVVIAKPAPAPVLLPPAPPPADKTPAWRKFESPPKPVAPEVLTVSQLTAQVKRVLEPAFSKVLVRGEISNFRGENARGHLYFALKDARASIDVKLWATAAQKLKFKLKEGLSVVIEGTLDLYEPSGRYSLIVERIEPEGVGAQALAFEQLKAKLLAEGLIGDKRSKPKLALPFLPRRVGVVTSVTGAALKDFVKVLHRRHPRLSVLVADARVQGDGAVFEIRRALRWMCRQDVDVIVVTRGGGSADDLWTFNEEPVVRAIFECTVPVVSAIGHEIDVTLSDLVADVRAPTPSAAAELVAPSLIELEAQLSGLKARLVRSTEKLLMRDRGELRQLKSALGDPRRRISSQRLFLSNSAERMRGVLHKRTRREGVELKSLSQRLQRARPQALMAARRAELTALRTRLLGLGQRRLRGEHTELSKLSRELARHSPRPLITHGRQLLARQGQRLPVAIKNRVARDRERLEAIQQRLNGLDPRQVLKRGYALARKDNTVIRSASEVEVGDSLRIELQVGEIEVRVTSRGLVK